MENADAMKGYIYITGNGADPGAGRVLNDPIFSKVPTLGACMPNIRRAVRKGDYIFVISGKMPNLQQYVVGGFKVADKIDALMAHERFPDYRLHRDAEGNLQGNIIVEPDGKQHPLDHHDPATFEARIKNYIVGSDPVFLTSDRAVERGRAQTLGKLSQILEKPQKNRIIDMMGRWAKLDEQQIHKLVDWLTEIKG